MNRPSRTDEPQKGDGYNQNPNELSNDLTTNEDLNGISNARALRGGGEDTPMQDTGQGLNADGVSRLEDPDGRELMQLKSGAIAGSRVDQQAQRGPFELGPSPPPSAPSDDSDGGGEDVGSGRSRARSALHRTKKAIWTFSKFIGPGFMVAVSYSMCFPTQFFLPLSPPSPNFLSSRPWQLCHRHSRGGFVSFPFALYCLAQ